MPLHFLKYLFEKITTSVKKLVKTGNFWNPRRTGGSDLQTGAPVTLPDRFWSAHLGRVGWLEAGGVSKEIYLSFGVGGKTKPGGFLPRRDL